MATYRNLAIPVKNGIRALLALGLAASCKSTNISSVKREVPSAGLPPSTLYIWAPAYVATAVAMDTEQALRSSPHQSGNGGLHFESQRVSGGSRFNLSSGGRFEGKNALFGWTHALGAMNSDKDDFTRDDGGKSATLIKLKISPEARTCVVESFMRDDKIQPRESDLVRRYDSCDVALHRIFPSDAGADSLPQLQEWAILNWRVITDFAANPKELGSELLAEKDGVLTNYDSAFLKELCRGPSNCSLTKPQDLKDQVIPKIDNYLRLTERDVAAIYTTGRGEPKNSWKLSSEAPDFSFHELSEAMLNELKAKHAVAEHAKIAACYSDPAFINSMLAIEKAIADTAIHFSSAQGANNGSDVLSIATKLNGRLMQLIVADATNLLNMKGKIVSELNLRSAVDGILSEVFGQCKATDLGCVGKNPQDIREVFLTGNFRERMFLNYRGTWAYLSRIYGTMTTTAKVAEIIAQEGFGWKLAQSPFITADPVAVGPYARVTSRDYLRSNRAPIIPLSLDSPLRVPFSAREKAINPSLQFITGKALFRPSTTASNKVLGIGESDYLKALETLKFATISGISGTTDQILSLAIYLDFDKEELIDLRLALLAWMLDSGDHSSIEILLASKSFKVTFFESLEITPDFYKKIHHHPAFLVDLERSQNAYGVDLPDKVLTRCMMEN